MKSITLIGSPVLSMLLLLLLLMIMKTYPMSELNSFATVMVPSVADEEYPGTSFYCNSPAQVKLNQEEEMMTTRRL